MSSERGIQIRDLAMRICASSYPTLPVEIFDSADGPLAVANIRVRPGKGRVYTLSIESDVTEDQIRKFIGLSISN